MTSGVPSPGRWPAGSATLYVSVRSGIEADVNDPLETSYVLVGTAGLAPPPPRRRTTVGESHSAAVPAAAPTTTTPSPPSSSALRLTAPEPSMSDIVRRMRQPFGQA